METQNLRMCEASLPGATSREALQLERWPSAWPAGYLVCGHFHKPKKKKKMPNQFSKNLVALPLASFLSLPASSSGHLLILNRTKQHNTSCSVFPLETFTSASGLAAGRGLPSQEPCLTVFRTPEFLTMDAFWGH